MSPRLAHRTEGESDVGKNTTHSRPGGAGIGGLTAAATLLRQGFDVDVYEQATTLREAGVGLHLGSNGSRILHRLGLAAGLDAVAVRPAALEVRGFDDGRVFARQPMGGRRGRTSTGPLTTPSSAPTCSGCSRGWSPSGTCTSGGAAPASPRTRTACG
ncbi:NAD(P)-binding protein [Nonomuraea salmonea]|uniref:NAD(P)-binding protein n=1 Tax=Nonomuraea salmonea TaxID=46181 RepID=UPI002FE96278